MNNIDLCINLLERVRDDAWKIEQKENLYRETVGKEWKERQSIYQEIEENFNGISKENYKRTLMLVRKMLKEEYE